MEENELSRMKELEQAFSEMQTSYKKQPLDLIDFTKKFTSYYNLFKEIFPECVKGYDLKPCS